MTSDSHTQDPIAEYIAHGWSLVPIPTGSKGPKTAQWNTKEQRLPSRTALPDGNGVGLAHAYSGTMALDIDNWEMAASLLSLFGVDLNALYTAEDAVVIDSGREGRGKLLYAMPEGVALPSKKVIVNSVTVYELRCATTNGLTVQDVLPPSIHPVTQRPYKWSGKGHWSRLPAVPKEILSLWQNLLDQDKERSIGGTGDSINTSWDEIRSALSVIPPDCSRDEWRNVGMGLHWAGTHTQNLDQALMLWNDWSAMGTKYPGVKDIWVQWNSFSADKAIAIRTETIFHIARQYGWVRPQIDVSGLFTAVNREAAAMPPADITLTIRPPAPDMDMDLWPSVLRTRSLEVADGVGCDPLVPLFAGLGAVCGVIDARIRLELMPGFQVPPILWLMTLGDPADKKSPGARPMLSPLKQIEAEDRPRYQKDLLEWEGREAAYAGAKKSFLDWSASPEALLDASQAPYVPDMPAPPVAMKITVSDITSQKLVRSAADRPRGLLCHLDEMSSWIKKLVDKTSGEDRSAWVVSYEGDRYEMDRVGAGSIHAENLAVSIYGNIQPAVFKSNLAALSADGLLQRFIPAILRADQTRLGNPVAEHLTSSAAWENTLRLVYALQPTKYTLSTDAYHAYREFQQWYEESKKDERLLLSNDVFMTAFGKLEGTAGRLILLFHVLEKPFSTIVDAGVVHRVIQLIRSYLIPAYRYALGEVAGVDVFDQWVCDHIIHHYDKGQITLSELKRSARRALDGKSVWTQDQMVIGAMATLETAKWVVRIDDGSRENHHHAEWAINPILGEQFKEHRKRVIQARQRVAEARWSNSSKPKPKVYGYEGG